MVVSTVEEEQTVRNESRVDIRPLNVDIVDVSPTAVTFLAREELKLTGIPFYTAYKRYRTL